MSDLLWLQEWCPGKIIDFFRLTFIQQWQRLTFPPGDPAVLSAMKSLTSRFEMGLGITSSL